MFDMKQRFCHLQVISYLTLSSIENRDIFGNIIKMNQQTMTSHPICSRERVPPL